MDAREHRARHIAHNEGKNFNKLSKAEKNKCLRKAEGEVTTESASVIDAPLSETEAPLENVLTEKIIEKAYEGEDDDSNSGTGQPDTAPGSPDTGEPEQPEKPKAKRTARKRTKKVL